VLDVADLPEITHLTDAAPARRVDDEAC